MVEYSCDDTTIKSSAVLIKLVIFVPFLWVG